MFARCKVFLASVSEAIGVRELSWVAGLALLGYGLSLVYWPSAFIVPGMVLTAVAIFGVR